MAIEYLRQSGELAESWPDIRHRRMDTTVSGRLVSRVATAVSRNAELRILTGLEPKVVDAQGLSAGAEPNSRVPGRGLRYPWMRGDGKRQPAGEVRPTTTTANPAVWVRQGGCLEAPGDGLGRRRRLLGSATSRTALSPNASTCVCWPPKEDAAALAGMGARVLPGERRRVDGGRAALSRLPWWPPSGKSLDATLSASVAQAVDQRLVGRFASTAIAATTRAAAGQDRWCASGRPADCRSGTCRGRGTLKKSSRYCSSCPTSASPSAQARQRERIHQVAHRLYSGRRRRSARFMPLRFNTADDAARLRVVVDQIASTEGRLERIVPIELGVPAGTL